MNKKDFIDLSLLIQMFINGKQRSPKETVIAASAIYDAAHGTKQKKRTEPTKTVSKETSYQKLEKDFPMGFDYFNQLLKVWADTRGRDGGAKAFYTICEGFPSKEKFKHYVYAAGVYAAGRKENPADPIMLQGWLSDNRADDVRPFKAVKSQAIADAIDEEIRTLLGDQARYQVELDKNPDDKALIEIMESIKSRLKIARGVKNG